MSQQQGGSPNPVSRLVSTVQQGTVDIGGIVDGIVGRVKGIVNDALRAVFEPLGAALEGILQLVGQLVAGFLGHLAETTDVIDTIRQQWRDNWPGLVFPLSAFAANATAAGSTAVRNAFEGFVGPSAGDIAGSNVPAAPAAGNPADVRHAIDSLPLPFRWILDAGAAFASSIAYLQALHAGGISLYQQASLSEVLPTPLSPQELAEAVVQSQVGADFGRAEAERSGLSNELFDIMVSVAGSPPGVMDTLELWRRGKLSDEEVTQAIAESRLKNKYIGPIKELRFILPSPSDLVRFLVRDAFDDQVATELQTDSEFEQKYSPDIFNQVGLSEDLARRFWRSHWQLPSPTQLFEMHHRTTDEPTDFSQPVALPNGGTVHRVVSADMLLRTLAINDLLPPFLDKYRLISFEPLNRIDSRRMFLADMLTEDELYRSYIDLGYDERNAQRFLDWLRSVKVEAKNAKALRDASPVIQHLRDMYRQGLLDSDGASSELTNIGVDPSIVDLWLRADDLQRERTRADAIRNAVHRLYVGAFLTEDEARGRLSAEGYTSSELDRLFTDWRVDLEFRERTDEEKHIRELTKANVVDAYKEHALSRDDAVQLLSSMGYVPNEIDFWLADADRDEQKSINSTLREAIHADYVDEIIDTSDASAQLDSIGLIAEQRNALLRRWATERRRKEPKLSVGQIEAAFKTGTVDEPRVRDLLVGLRYSADEIDVLVAVWTHDMSLADQRLALSRESLTFREQQAQTTRADRLARQQQQDEARLALEDKRAQDQLAKEQRAADAESKRHDAAVAEAQRRETVAAAEHAKQRDFTAQLQQQRQAATDERQQRTFTQQITLQQRREDNSEKRFQEAKQARIDAETRREQAQIDRDNRLQQAKIQAESRAEQRRIAQENRGEARQLSKELRQQEATVSKEQRAQAARVSAEQRVAERASILASAQAQAQAQIQQIREDEANKLADAAAQRLQRLQDATQRRIGALT